MKSHLQVEFIWLLTKTSTSSERRRRTVVCLLIFRAIYLRKRKVILCPFILPQIYAISTRPRP